MGFNNSMNIPCSILRPIHITLYKRNIKNHITLYKRITYLLCTPIHPLDIQEYLFFKNPL